MSLPAKWSNRNSWISIHWFWSNTIIKQQMQEHYINLQMDQLDNPLTTHQILTSWEVSIEPYRICQFGCIDDSDSLYGNGVDPTWTCTRRGGQNLLRTLHPPRTVYTYCSYDGVQHTPSSASSHDQITTTCSLSLISHRSVDRVVLLHSLHTHDYELITELSLRSHRATLTI